MPEHVQTSPLHVHSAADLPSGKKSNPPKRIHALYGFFSGGVSVSTTYASSLGPATAPFVSTACVHRAGPPVVSVSGSTIGPLSAPAGTLVPITSLSTVG